MAVRDIIFTVDDVEDNMLPKVLEILARCAAGIAMEGIEVRLMTHICDEHMDESA